VTVPGLDRRGLAGWNESGYSGLAVPSGFQKLGSSVLTAAATTIPSISFPERDLLYILIRITGYSNTDRPMMRFNGASTGYWDRWVTAAAAGATLANVQNVSGTGCRIAANDVTTSRVVSAFIANRNGASKIVMMEDHTGTGAAATAGVAHVAGAGEWVNNAQINSMLVVTVAGRDLSIGSSFTVFGRNTYPGA
jgi:hypothetical protein